MITVGGEKVEIYRMLQKKWQTKKTDKEQRLERRLKTE